MDPRRRKACGETEHGDKIHAGRLGQHFLMSQRTRPQTMFLSSGTPFRYPAHRSLKRHTSSTQVIKIFTDNNNNTMLQCSVCKGHEASLSLLPPHQAPSFPLKTLQAHSSFSAQLNCQITISLSQTNQESRPEAAAEYSERSISALDQR